MHTIRRWLGRLRALLFRDRFDRELRDEMRFHIEQETERRVRGGMSRSEARRAALRDFGGVQKAREQVHQERWGGGIEAVWRDVRYGVRTLLRSPGYTAVTVATVALAIAADTAVFSIIRGSLLEPLPYADPGRLVRVVTGWQGQPDGNSSPAEFLDLSEDLDDVSAIGAYSFGGLTLQEGDLAERVPVAAVTAGVLPVLGVEPSIGRAFTREDGLARDQRLLLTDGFWRRQLAGDPAVVGTTIRVDGQEATILGVLPPGFRMPEELSSSTRVDVLVPVAFEPADDMGRGWHYLRTVARLAPGVSLEQARAELDAVVRSWAGSFADAYPPDMHFTVRYRSLREAVVGDARPALLLVGGAVLLILLVACANLAALCLSRYEMRHRELTLRAALGAGRGRLVTQVLVESLLVAAVGGVLGIGLAHVGIDILVAAGPANLPRLDAVRLDLPVAAVGLGLSLLAGMVFGSIPAVGAAGVRLRRTLAVGDRGGVGLRGERLRQGLVVAQLSLAVALLVSAGLLGRSFLAMTRADPGYRTAHVLTARVSLPATSYDTDPERTTFFREATRVLGLQPGVETAGAVTNLPLATTLGDMGFHVEGVGYADDQVDPAADWQVVVPGYFETMGIALLRGRVLDVGDRADSEGVVVVNETFARTWFPGQDPIGKRIVPGGELTQPAMAPIVGVVADVSHGDLGQWGRAQMYFAHEQFRFWSSGRALSALTFVVASARPPEEVTTLVRRTIARLDPALAVYDVVPMEGVRGRAVAGPRFFTALVGVFALLALTLATVGVYGVMAYGVAVRRREFGIRMALGARAQEIVRGVLARGMRLTLLGLLLGAALAALGSRAIAALLFGVALVDPVTLLGVVVVLGTVAVVGSLVPALRAARSAVGVLLRQP